MLVQRFRLGVAAGIVSDGAQPVECPGDADVMVARRASAKFPARRRSKGSASRLRPSRLYVSPSRHIVQAMSAGAWPGSPLAYRQRAPEVALCLQVIAQRQVGFAEKDQHVCVVAGLSFRKGPGQAARAARPLRVQPESCRRRLLPCSACARPIDRRVALPPCQTDQEKKGKCCEVSGNCTHDFSPPRVRRHPAQTGATGPLYRRPA